MNERGVDSRGFVPKNSLGETDFVRDVLFVYRWAKRVGRETLFVSDAVIQGARECLGDVCDMGIDVDDHVAILEAGIKKVLSDNNLNVVKLDFTDAESGQVHLVFGS